MDLDFSHGGDLTGAKECFGIPENDFLDFSSNINAIGYPDIIPTILVESLNYINKYPDNKCRDLKNAISDYLGVNINNIIPGNGAMELLRLVMEISSIKRVLIIGPTFVEYENLARSNNKEILFHELSASFDFEFIPDEIFSKLENIDAIFICNPNNPTSKLYKKRVMLYFQKKCEEAGVILVIDETFIELTIEGNANSLVGEVNNCNNLIIIRAATKYFAIPGIRLGYAVVSERFVKYFLERKVSWSVNTFATRLGDIFRIENEYRKKTLDWLVSEKEYLFCELSSIKMFKVYKPDSIFVLLKILDLKITSDKLYNFLGKKGILIRNAKNFKFLGDSYIRVAVKDRQSNNCLISALKSQLS